MASLSVIIPVYDSLSTLDRCVESVLQQNVDGMEVILVDDGSTDGSSALCDSIAVRNESVRVIHRPNGGLSAARNTGIEAAKGEWISFVDSDDALAPGTLNGNLEYARQLPDTDLVEFPVTVRYGSPDSFSFDFKPIDTSAEQVFTYWIQSQGYNHCFACNKLFRATLFSNICFPKGESFEDAAICPDIIRSCRTVRYSDIGRYLYYKSDGSITRRYRFSNQEPLFRHNLRLLQLITAQGFGNECKAKLWNQCLNLLIDLGRCKDADRKYIGVNASELSRLKPCDTLRHADSFKQKIKALMGPKATSRLLTIRKYA